MKSGLVAHSMGGAVIEDKSAKGFAVMFGSSDRMIGFSCALKKGLLAALFSGTATASAKAFSLPPASFRGLPRVPSDADRCRGHTF